MLYTRQAQKTLKKWARNLRAVALLGPRQSGKSTLCRMAFPKKDYVSLENPSLLQLIVNDPEGFLANYPKGAVIDEAQRFPGIFSYLQRRLDENDARGQFILTGSNNFLLQQNISQSLAGRIAYLNLFPLTFSELRKYGRFPENWENAAINGFYPEVTFKNIDPIIWYASYSKTYIERDVRLIKNISNLHLFTRFVQLCAGRSGKILNIQSLAADVGIDHKTAQSWLSVLESSYIIFLLKPYANNFNKQIVKSPKLYFLDTGLLCYLLNINKSSQLFNSPFRGQIFENLIIADKVKENEHLGQQKNFFYWRNKTGIEVDLISQDGDQVEIAEIKSGATYQPDSYKSLDYFQNLFGRSLHKIIYYGGIESFKLKKDSAILSWNQLGLQ